MNQENQVATETEPTVEDVVQRIIAGLDTAIKHFSKVNAVIEEIDQKFRDDPSIELKTLGIALFEVKDRYETLDKAVKRSYHFADGLSKAIIPNRLKDAGIDGFRIPEIARSFSVIEKVSASFLDKDEGIKWLREIGQGDLVQETVNAGTLASFCRNMLLEEGREPPAEVVKVTTYNATSMVKYRPK